MADDSPAAVLVNIDGDIVRVGKEGDTISVTTRDEDQLEILQKMLAVLQKIELHMAIMTELDNNDVEDNEDD